MEQRHRDRTKFEVLKVVFLENIGKVIRKHRMQKNIKIETLAADAGVSKSAISRYETGGADITASMMARISVILGFMNSDESSVKRDVLRTAFVAANEVSANGKTAKTLVNAALDYTIRDEDKEVRDRLKWYRKMCEKSL